MSSRRKPVPQFKSEPEPEYLAVERAELVTEADAIARLAIKGQRQVTTVDHKNRSFLIVPEGMRAQEITDPHGMILTPPERIKQAVELLDKDSFIEYVKRHALDGTVTFADPFKDNFIAAIDWHGAAEAAFVEHRATLTLQRSEEWKRWTGISGKLMPQAEFARFLEENAADVADPSGADLLEVARDLSAKRDVNWKSAIRLENGDQEFEYSEETTALAKTGRGVISVPRSFTLRIPIYMNEPTVEIMAWLRWKLEGGSIGIGIELHRPVFVQQACFKIIGLDIASRTQRDVLTGRIGQCV